MRRLKRHTLLPVLLTGLLTTGCSVTRIATQQTTGAVLRALPAYDRETDLELANHAIMANLKFLEGVLESNPDDPDLLLATSRTFSRYTYGFVEDRLDSAAQTGDSAEVRRLTDQAIDFYTRARAFGLRALDQTEQNFTSSLTQNDSHFLQVLQRLGPDDAPALYWTAFAWGNLIRLQPNRPELLPELTRVVAMMQRVLELDDSCAFGGAHLFFGVYYSSLPVMFGGNPALSEEHFQQAIEITHGQYLPARFAMARYYCKAVDDREQFESILHEIVDAPPTADTNLALENKVAQHRAARWLEMADSLFAD